LDSSGLLLDPDYVFYEENAYCFCYYPAVSEEIEKKLDSFAEQLLGMTDHENEKAVVLVYAFYRLVKENNRTAVSVLQQLLEQEDAKEEENVTTVNTEKTENKRYSGYDPEEEYDTYSYTEPSEKEPVQAGQKSTDITAVISFLLLSLGSMAAFFYFVWQDGNFYIARILSEKQYLLAIAFFLLGIAGISVNAAVAFMRKRTGEKQAENTGLKADAYTENEDVTLT
jgi:hypothetical protein